MTITLEISTSMQSELARQAEISGRGIEVHAASLLEDALRLSSSEHRDLTQRPPFGRTLVEVFDEARRLGLFADGGLDFSRDPSPGRAVDLS